MKKQHVKWGKAAVLLAVVAVGLIGCTDDVLGPTDNRDKLLGTWSCAETGPTSSTFTVTITKNTADSTKVYLANLNNIGAGYKPQAVVSGNNLTIPTYNAMGYTTSGSGAYSPSSGNITLSYTVSDGNTTDNFQATLTK